MTTRLDAQVSLGLKAGICSKCNQRWRDHFIGWEPNQHGGWDIHCHPTPPPPGWEGVAALTAEANARGEGFKADALKDRWDLLPWNGVKNVVKVLTLGAKKYAEHNWQKVPEARSRYFAAAQRHIVAWAQGEELDPESQLPHLAHAICCLLFLNWFDERRH